MGASLSSLFISQSYQSLIHLGTDTTITTFTSTPAELQDGFGNGSGVLLDNAGNIIASGSIKAVNDISSSTLNGVGNVTLYSASVASRLSQLEADSGSQDQRLDSLEAFSSSQESKDATLAIYTASVNQKFDAISVYTSSMNAYTQSADGRLNSLEAFSSSQESKDATLAIYTASVSNSLGLINSFTQSAGGRLNSIESYTSSLRGALTVNGNDVTFANDITVVGTINAYEIITTIESSSVIFSSGSNIFGDALNDTQTLNGTVIISGSQDVSGSVYITGEVSSSTIAGIGNTTAFSQSVNARLNELETWSSSLQTDFATTLELTQTASFLQNQINQKLNTSSFNAYTQSANAAFNSYTQSVNTTISTLATTASVNNLINATGSFATTGSNTFIGTQTISGSLISNVITLSIVSSTASMDFSQGNFFLLTLASGSNTRLAATNIGAGQTINLLVSQPSVSSGSLSYPSYFKFPFANSYSASAFSGAVDILSFITVGNGNVYGVNVKNMI